MEKKNFPYSSVHACYLTVIYASRKINMYSVYNLPVVSTSNTKHMTQSANFGHIVPSITL